MRLERSKSWWMAGRAAKVTRPLVLVCSRSIQRRKKFSLSAAASAVEETRIAFGRFVNLMRRRRSYSIEQLAEAADLDPRELLVIEDDVYHLPEPRTVYKLAVTFKVSQRRLMQLAGLAATNDDRFPAGGRAIRCALQSVQKLTPEESSALEAFVAVLSEQETKRAK